jgi:hypothetical protein
VTKLVPRRRYIRMGQSCQFPGSSTVEHSAVNREPKIRSSGEELSSIGYPIQRYAINFQSTGTSSPQAKRGTRKLFSIDCESRDHVVCLRVFQPSHTVVACRCIAKRTIKQRPCAALLLVLVLETLFKPTRIPLSAFAD